MIGLCDLWLMMKIILLTSQFMTVVDFAGAFTIDMYQKKAGIRAIGANATIVSEIHDVTTGNAFNYEVKSETLVLDSRVAYLFVNSESNPAEDDFTVYPLEYEYWSLITLRNYSTNLTRGMEWNFSYLPEKYNNLSLITVTTTNDVFKKVILRVEACKSYNVTTKDQDSWIRIETTQPGHYNDTAYCKCFKTEEKLYTPEGTEAAGVATCGDNAQWVGCKNLQCWSAPSDIKAVQMKTTAGLQSPFSCTYTEGFPNVSDKILRINDVNVSENYVLASQDHGKSLSCQVISDFTKKNGSLCLSSPITISVHYPPESSTLSSAILVMDLNDSKLFNYSVNANPSNGSVDITFKNESGHDVSDMFNVFHNYTKENSTLHSYEFNVNLTSDQDYGNYNVCASTKFPIGTDCSTLSICNAATSTPSLPDTATSSVTTGSKNLLGPGLPAPIIGAIVAGAIVIMLIAVGIVIHKKRKQSSSKDNVREETVNVLYGSAQYQTSSVENQENVKHEKSNVLYESASGSAGGDLVEYATANPDGIESDDAVQYATSNADVENTGAIASASSAAEPSCSGNTSVYAQINKKKGKVNDGYKIEMHDTSEATYTVVDKSNKRNKDNVPEVYAVVNKPRAKD